MSEPFDRYARRDFLRTAGLLLGASFAPAPGVVARADQRRGGAPDLLAAPPAAEVRIGMVGVGLQGTSHVQNFLRVPGARITAVCDIVPEKVQNAQKLVAEAGQREPAGYSRGPRDFDRLCETEDLDLVFTATPWEWHVPVCLSAMKNGKHAATEVPAAMTLDDCWALVGAAEKYRRHCVMMENCNYGRSELMVLNMARKGMFGEILHAEGGYLHDLRAVKFEKANEGLWRRAWSRTHNANLYPTHGLGPVANCLDINRGDRFESLVSMSGPSRGLQLYAKEHFPDGAPERAERFVLGDVNMSLIRTARGRTIFVGHNTNLPRPYSRINMVQGTRGLFQGYPDRVYLEGRSKEHTWDAADAYRDEFDHSLWKKLEADAQGAGHGGMDYLEDYRLIQCLRDGLPTDMNVYDAAALSAVIELTGRSVARKSAPVDFPDFTRGRWRDYPALTLDPSGPA